MAFTGLKVQQRNNYTYTQEFYIDINACLHFSLCVTLKVFKFFCLVVMVFDCLSEYFSCASLCPFEAAQEVSKQTQAAIGKAADKATNTIKEFGQKLETK